ncbi:hypothetical protein TNCV_671311 [Trichonephila clavipes]|nr:hypothetical protein TNCV_671311 [Trichonephila clavipes]
MRPPTRWLDDVDKDLKLIGINQWKVIMTDRINWRMIKGTEKKEEGGKDAVMLNAVSLRLGRQSFSPTNLGRVDEEMASPTRGLSQNVLDESRSFFRVHTGYFSNIPKCIKAEFIASWACSQSSVVSSSQR